MHMIFTKKYVKFCLNHLMNKKTLFKTKCGFSFNASEIEFSQKFSDATFCDKVCQNKLSRIQVK